MILLEQLYDCAENHLSTDRPDWVMFAQNFKEVFGAHMTIYRATFQAESKSYATFDILATSAPDIMRKYVEYRMYERHVIPETNLPPLEPVRRSDFISDEDFLKLGTLTDFLVSNGIFYNMVVPAVLPDGAFVGLYTWRDKEESDFEDIEKQRLALFTRHLLAIVGTKSLQAPHLERDVSLFGQKYELTATEIEILAALLQGHSLKTIAAQTSRTYGTVRWHVQNILSKCQVGSQKDLLREFYLLIKR